MDPDSIARIFYNIISPFYDLFFGARSPWAAGFRRRMIERLDLKKGDKVLEVSIGTGSNLPYIHEKVGHTGKIYGLDISEGMLEKCRANAGKEKIQVELKVGNASERLPYPDNSFDAVLNFGAFNFFADKKRALKEMIRVAKPDAKIVVGDETLLLFKVFKPPVELLGREKIADLKVAYERMIVYFWFVDFRRRR